MADTGDKIIRVYSDFRGVDYRGDECALNRSPDALNVWRDYNDLTGIKTRPALKKIGGHIEGKPLRDFRLLNVGDGKKNILFLDKEGKIWYQSQLKPIFEVGTNEFLFEFDGSLYGMGSNGFLKIAGGGVDECFVPATSIGALPNGAGRKTYQNVNMLTPVRLNAFHTNEDIDGSTFVEFHLDTRDVDKDYMPIIEVDGKRIFEGKSPSKDPEDNGLYVSWVFDSGLEIDPSIKKQVMQLYYEDGVIVVFGQEFKPPKTAGSDNISVKFAKTIKGESGNDTNLKKILGCTIVEEFDNRIFLSGNPDYPNLVFHSSLNNPMYFSDTDVYEDGKDDGYIRSMVSGNNALWVFRDTDKGNGVYYHTAAFDNTYGKIYPSAHSSVSMGCVGGAINFLDDIVFFSRQGMESISQNITAEQFATHKSSLVDRIMSSKEGYKDMVFAEWEGYLFVFIGADVFLADSRAVMANEGHYEYEWYHWKLFIDDKENKVPYDRVTCASVHDGDLYIGTERGCIYAFDKHSNDGDAYSIKNPNTGETHTPIESYWTTPKDKFASSNKLKTTNKKGCIVEAEGDLTVSSKVEGGGFDNGEEYTGIEDHIVPKIKRKKFKDIQLKFHSNTKFKLESATLEAFVGSFIKR